MKELTAREWWNYINPISTALLYTVLTWFGRKKVRQTWQRYLFVFALVVMLLYVVMDARFLFLQPDLPLAFRVIHSLCLALLVITVIAAWLRKQT